MGDLAPEEPQNVFRRNLHRLAAAHQMDFDGLASALGFIRAEKKWLRRAWETGLSRPDDRTLQFLSRLAKCLGLGAYDDLWKPDISLDPAVIASVKIDAWRRLVGIVKEYVEAMQMLRSHSPSEMREIEEKYRFDELGMIALWTLRHYRSVDPIADGNDGGDEKETALRDRLIAETQSARTFVTETSFRERVRKRLEQLPEWAAMFRELLGQTGDPEDWCSESERILDSRLTEAIARHPTEEEVCERFRSRYFAAFRSASSPTPAALEVVETIIDELRLHRHWGRHVELEFNGDEGQAVEKIRFQWSEYSIASKGSATINAFTSVYRHRILDSIPDPEDSAGMQKKLKAKKSAD